MPHENALTDNFVRYRRANDPEFAKAVQNIDARLFLVHATTHLRDIAGE